MISTHDMIEMIFSIPGIEIQRLMQGSKMIYKYIINSHQNDPVRTVLEVLLVIFLIWYFSKSKPEDSSKIKLTEQEIQELIDEWEPEPLVASLSEEQKFDLEKIPVINGPVGVKVKLADVS